MLRETLPDLANPDDDPWLWLEDIDGARAVAWVEEQNDRTRDTFANGSFAADRDALAAIYDRPDRIPMISRRGESIYNFWQDARNPRGLWRRTDMASYRSPDTQWDIVLDLDDLAAREGEDWIWQGASFLHGTHDRAILRLSRGGGDAVAMREFDVIAKCFVEDGFILPEAKGFVQWLDRNTLLVMSPLGKDMATSSGYGRTVRLWKRGTSFDSATMLFEGQHSDVTVGASVDRSAARERIWFYTRPKFDEVECWTGDRTGAGVRLDLPRAMELAMRDNWLIVQPRIAWQTGARIWPADTLLAVALDDFLAGGRDFRVLFEPGERRALQNFFWAGDRLVISILDNLEPLFELCEPGPDSWQKTILPGVPATGLATASLLDADVHESNGDLLVNTQDPLTPPTLSLVEPGAAPQVLRRSPEAFQAGHLRVTRHEARSSDGERIPYVQVGPPGETGNAPVHMSGYGGFAVTQPAYYNSAIGKLWLERGGTHVIANIRGGGEFGTRWHEAGRGEHKARAHDDFAAVAADLVARGVTSPSRIAAEGGSNGGLLIANMLTRYPGHFGALFCTIPLIDMRRYIYLLAGASWISEYGDPEKPGEWAYLRNISAYHNAEPGKAYPPILIATLRKDDRVHPGHARKMAAKLQALGHDAWFHEPAAGGHGYGKDNSERAAFTVLGYTFLRRKIGWSDETG